MPEIIRSGGAMLMKFQTAARNRWSGSQAIPVAALIVLAACGGSSTSGGGLGSGDLLVGVIAPFTGADAGLGPAYYAACLAAAPEINNNGGGGGAPGKGPQVAPRGEPPDGGPPPHHNVPARSPLMAAVGVPSDQAAGGGAG